jgi:hypothetical protein
MQITNLSGFYINQAANNGLNIVSLAVPMLVVGKTEIQ